MLIRLEFRWVEDRWQTNLEQIPYLLMWPHTRATVFSACTSSTLHKPVVIFLNLKSIKLGLENKKKTVNYRAADKK